MTYFARLGAVCALGLSALAGQAQADIYVFTHSGTVASGIDIYGLFGRQNANLTGRDYSVSYMFDADSLSLNASSGPEFSARSYYTDKSLVKITINGKDNYITPLAFYYNLVDVDLPGTSSTTYGLNVMAVIYGETLSFELASEMPFMGATDLSTPVQYSPTDADLANPFALGRYWDAVDFKVVFNTKEVSLTSQAGDLPAIPTADVPEPASWALMIVGFGGAGAMLRSRRRPALMG